MTTAFNLGLPTDIPWRKVCVTADMMDRVVCDPNLPAKWQTSIAVFEYVPADEYQSFPDYKITYLKVTATITGYQPLDEEIQGEIDWDGVDVTTLEGLTDLLATYWPCTGAILQVVVGPPGRAPDLPFDRYPFFLDFEPKKRELYEMATDTKERQSRSFETLNLTKSAGSAQSQEVLDVDMGGGGFGGQASYAGTGGGFSYTAPSGQWGTRSLNSQQSQVERSADSGTEKRETFSHTTQLSQMYHLLDSYHLGTNRAVFFVQPRPHVLEEPSGFVRGPRKVEGIQEFFLVVAQPKDAGDFCVSVRLDTAHLVETDILEYDQRTDISDLATATARIPTKNDTPDGTTTRRACFIDCWDVTYKCYRTRDVDDQIYTAPDGYTITGYVDLVREASHGSTSVTIAPGGKTLTVHAEASGHICFEDSGVCLDCPDEVDKWSGYARRQVQVNLRSDEPIVKVGTQQELLITTRGLCCCPEGPELDPGPLVKASYPVPVELGGRFYEGPRRAWPGGTAADGGSSEDAASPRGAGAALLGGARAAAKAADAGAAGAAGGCACGGAAGPGEPPERRMSIRQANAIGDFVRERMVKAFRDPRPGHEPRRFIETDVFLRQLESFTRRSRAGRQRVTAKPKRLPEEVLKVVSEQLGKAPGEVTAGEVLRVRGADLARRAGLSPRDAAQLKLGLLGVKLKPGKPRPEGRDTRKK